MRKVVPAYDMDTERDRSVIQSIEKAALILDLFTKQKKELTLHEISQMTGYNKTTALRFCHTLESVGYLEKMFIGSTPYYRLGIQLFHLGMRTLHSIDLAARARPYLAQASRQLGDNCYLFIERNRQALCIEAVKGDFILQDATTNAGDVLPLNRGGGPLAMLAFMPEDKQESLMRDFDLSPAQLDGLRGRIAATRRNGYSFSSHEVYPDTAAVGTPIFNHAGEVVGAISVGGFIKRFSDELLPLIVETLLSASGQLSRELGWEGFS